MMEASKKSHKAIVSHLIDTGKTSLSKSLFDTIYSQHPFFDDVIIRFAQARSKLQLVGDTIDSTLSWTLKQNKFDLALFTRMLDEVTFIDGEKSEVTHSLTHITYLLAHLLTHSLTRL